MQGQYCTLLQLLPLLLLLLQFPPQAQGLQHPEFVCKRQSNDTESQLERLTEKLRANHLTVVNQSMAASLTKETCDADFISQKDNSYCPVFVTVEPRHNELPSAQVHINCYCRLVQIHDSRGRCVQLNRTISVMRLRPDSNLVHMCPEGTAAFEGYWTDLVLNSGCSFVLD